MEKEEIEKKIQEIEARMNALDFWNDKDKAQATIQEYQELKDALEGVGKHDKGDAVLTIFAGAGGTDAEDFARMLLDMYFKYAQSRNWSVVEVHSNQNDHGGYRNVTVEISGKNVYGDLKNESGVHRLVRISPFNAAQKRHTAFAMVEVTPKFKDIGNVDIDESDVEIEFSKSSGPGGQNVNKRETAVRITHKPSGISVHVSSERSQEANRKKAMEILEGKLYYRLDQERKAQEKGLSISATTSNEWGNQIRNYVMHPYKLVKDVRTNVEVRDVESVLEGNIDEFIQAEKDLV